MGIPSSSEQASRRQDERTPMLAQDVRAPAAAGQKYLARITSGVTHGEEKGRRAPGLFDK